MENDNQPEIKPENNSETIFDEQEFSMEGYDKHIRQARNALYIAAAIMVLNAMLLFSKYPFDIEIMWLDYLIWIIYIGGFIALALWTKKKPYYAIIGGLILMGAFILINAIIDPATIFGGIIFKIAVILFLIKGLGDAKEAQQMKEQFNKTY
jgi:peptidoglycan/LPS O-acetylase OafA/YrhL